MHPTDSLLLKYAVIGAAPITLLVTLLFGFPPVSFIICAGLFAVYHAQQQP
jgi:type III secretory pathway component EscV